MNYPMYGNNQYYMQDLQNMRDRIDMQMRQMQQAQQPQVQQPSINQTFQLAPNQGNSDLDGKYANNIDEVKNTLALKNTLFIDKNAKNLWLKNADGTIRTFTLNEVIELDEKDKQILALQKQIEELKGVVLNAKSDSRNVDESIENAKSSNVSTNKSIKK